MDELRIGGKEVKGAEDLETYNNLDLWSNRLHGYGTAAYLGSVLPIPYVQEALKALGFLSTAGGDIVDAFNNKVSIPGLIGRFGLNTAAAVMPSAYAGRSATGLGRGLDKVGRSITKPFLDIKNPVARYGAGVGAGLGVTYIPEGVMNKNGDNVIIGAGRELYDDLSNWKEGGPLDRMIKIASIPLFLRHPRAARAAAGVGASAGAEELAAEELAAEELAAEEGPMVIGGGEAPIIEEAAPIVEGESGLVDGAAILAAAIAGVGNANASTTKKPKKIQKKQQRPKTVTGTYTGRPIDQSLMFTRSNNKPKTTTGTYIGKPSDNLLSGIIIGRRNGGKLDKLINLRK